VGSIVKAHYGRGVDAIKPAKAHVRYMAHRPDEWGNAQHRELWGDLEVDKQAAYGALDQAGADGKYVYRVILSPDPREQDADKRTLDLRSWAEATMAEAEAEHPGLRWFAAEHDDKEHRHVHVVALTNERLTVDDFRAMRSAADGNASDQLHQRERELHRDRGWDRER
jgi:hypothetical protein